MPVGQLPWRTPLDIFCVAPPHEHVALCGASTDANTIVIWCVPARCRSGLLRNLDTVEASLSVRNASMPRLTGMQIS